MFQSFRRQVFCTSFDRNVSAKPCESETNCSLLVSVGCNEGGLGLPPSVLARDMLWNVIIK